MSEAEVKNNPVTSVAAPKVQAKKDPDAGAKRQRVGWALLLMDGLTEHEWINCLKHNL